MFANTNKPLHVSVLFIRPSSGGLMPCFVRPEDGRIKRTEKGRGLFVFTNMFLTF